MENLNNTGKNQFDEKKFQELINDCHTALITFSNGFVGKWSKHDTLEEKISSIEFWMRFLKSDVAELMSIISEQIEILKPSK
jgi:hypothetical protein